MAADGTVAARVLWANDPRALRRAIEAALGGERTEIENRVAPMLRGTGCMYEIWEEAGGHAKTRRAEAGPSRVPLRVDRSRPAPAAPERTTT